MSVKPSAEYVILHDYLNVVDGTPQIRVDRVGLRLVRVGIRVVVSFYDQRINPLVLPIDEFTRFNFMHLLNKITD